MLAERGLEELRVNLLLKENSYVSDIILHRLILELKFYKLNVLLCIMFSSLVKRAFGFFILEKQLATSLPVFLSPT